ncbi:MAG: endonuclease/exonuclease/phosphatase family protein [Terrimicrobiaceae bacterium]
MFRLLTFNIQNGQPWDSKDPDNPRVDIDGVGRFLAAQNADIICLQEVERGYDGGRQIEPPPHFKRLQDILTGYDSVFAYPKKNHLEIPFGIGLAIFSKTPLREFERLDLPAASIEFDFGGKKRCASSRLLIGATTDIAGSRLRIMNTHLQAFFMIGALSDAYPDQRNLVEAELRKQAGPAILAGDMNTAPEESLVAQFERAGFSTVQKTVPTWKRRPYVVDHIFRNDSLRLISHQILPTPTSDHDAIAADFEFA